MDDPARVVCDMRNAVDTPQERAEEYGRLFATALAGRDRTDRLVRFRFRRTAVDENQVRSLAARERACCPFFEIRLSGSAEELWWETRVGENQDAMALLEEFYRLPDRLAEGGGTAVEGLVDRGLLQPRVTDD
jgi:hypothetical protein